MARERSCRTINGLPWSTPRSTGVSAGFGLEKRMAVALVAWRAKTASLWRRRIVGRFAIETFQRTPMADGNIARSQPRSSCSTRQPKPSARHTREKRPAGTGPIRLAFTRTGHQAGRCCPRRSPGSIGERCVMSESWRTPPGQNAVQHRAAAKCDILVVLETPIELCST